jgi:hypothetical protein
MRPLQLAMPLSPPAVRDELHQRHMTFRGYRRKDGRFDIECTLLDTKGYDMSPPGGTRTVPSGEPVHHMSIRVIVSDQLVVEDVEASSDATPFDICPEAVASLAAVKGLKIGPGWTMTIKRRLGGAEGCTHLVEMLAAMGTAAYQTIVPYNRMHGVETDGFPLEKKVDSCYAYAAHRPLVQYLRMHYWKRR